MLIYFETKVIIKALAIYFLFNLHYLRYVSTSACILESLETPNQSNI